MQSVRITGKPNLFLLGMLCMLITSTGIAQINSPYSRYGIGDIYNSQNVVNKAMGGLTAPYFDYQSVNFLNPATYSRLQTVTFDIGTEYESRTIRKVNTAEKFNSQNLNFNYLALGLPLMKNKDKMTTWGMAFGLRPFSKVNYSVEENSDWSGGERIRTLYEGDGSSNKAFIGTGLRLGNFALGLNGGFLFGQQNFTTRRNFLNDEIFYLGSSVESKTSFNRFVFDGGMHYSASLGKGTLLKLGATGFLKENLKASRDLLQQTFIYNAAGQADSLDVVDRKLNQKGSIDLPGGYSAGISLEKETRWMLGVQYEAAQWKDFRYYGQAGNLENTSMIRVGGFLAPKITSDNQGYFSRVTYRAGFFTGKDMIVYNNQQLPVWGATFGLTLPIRRWSSYSGQFTAIQTAFEFSQRGNKSSSFSENVFRINVGLNLADVWFLKRQFN